MKDWIMHHKYFHQMMNLNLLLRSGDEKHIKLNFRLTSLEICVFKFSCWYTNINIENLIKLIFNMDSEDANIMIPKLYSLKPHTMVFHCPTHLINMTWLALFVYPPLPKETPWQQPHTIKRMGRDLKRPKSKYL